MFQSFAKYAVAPAGPGLTAVLTAAPEIIDGGQGTYTFSNQSLGPIVPGRRILVCMNSTDQFQANFFSGVSVGAAACSVLSDGSQSAQHRMSTDSAAEMWIVQDDTNANADIVCDSSGTSPSRCGVALFAIYGLDSNQAHQVVVDAATPLNMNTNVEDLGLIIAMAAGRRVAGGAGTTWSGVVTEQSDVHNVAQGLLSTALEESAAAATPATVTATADASPTDYLGISASFSVPA